MKEVVYINQDAGYLMVDIINSDDFYTDKRILITGRLSERDRFLHKDVNVEYIIKYDRSTNYKRIKTWLLGLVQIYFKLLFKYRTAELFIVSNPPFTIFIPLFFKSKFTLYILDIYPDSLVEFNLLKKDNIFIKFWEAVNRRVMQRADSVITLTESMKIQLSKYCDINKIKVVPIWSPGGTLERVPKCDNWFIREYGLLNKFVILYSGNFGFTHNLDILLDLSAALKDLEVQVLLIGDGDQKKRLELRIQNENLHNCRILPWQDSTNLKYSLSAADLAVVTQDEAASSLSIPSKTFSLLSVGSIIMAITKRNSELWKLVNENLVGESFEANELSRMVHFVVSLMEDPHKRQKLSSNSLFFSKKFDPENAYKIRIG